MITENLKFNQWKNHTQLQIGDILQLKKDKFFYEIKNIVALQSDSTTYNEYYFYGFNILSSKNLYKYFENEHKEFKVFSK